jgi:crotonobetainyl-CoA:carnitine CoA-transferase CaiB-like acyl-CoA transferase
MAVHGRGRGRRAARLGVDCVTTATGVVLAQGALAALLARRRGAAVREISVSMPVTALLMVAQHLAAASAGHPDPLLRSRPGHPPPFRCADGVSVELDTRYAESWRLLWTSLGVPDTVAERAWRPFMLRHLTGQPGARPRRCLPGCTRPPRHAPSRSWAALPRPRGSRCGGCAVTRSAATS